jgi:DNA-binding transcriptional ArsR family regulator
MTPLESDVDPRLLVALGHPVRQEILLSMCDAPISVAGLVRLLALPLPTVRRHMRVLEANDAVEPAAAAAESDDVPFRTMIRPFLDDAHWQHLPPHRRRALFAVTLRRIAAHVETGMTDGEFDDPQAHVSLTRCVLDERGWQEMTDLLAGVIEEAMQIEAESAERLARAPDRPQLLAKLAILHFGRADDIAAPPETTRGEAE